MNKKNLRDVQKARENVRRYAWAQKIVEGWQQETAYAMQQNQAFFESMMPELTAWPEYGQNCPACVNDLSSMGESGLYRWTVEDPDRLICKYCNTEYPNPKYPETGSITASKMGQTFTFYLTDAERAHPEDRSGKYAFTWYRWPVHTSWTGIIRSQKNRWSLDQMVLLANLYAFTDNPSYAQRAAWIMDIMARQYPNWIFHSYDGTYADCSPAEAAISMGKYPRAGHFPVETIITTFEGRHHEGDHAILNNGFWGAGRFGCSGSDGGTLLRVVYAYDSIREAKHPDGTPIITPQMDHRIVHDLLLAGCDDTENWNEINNKCGPGRALSAAVGILFNRPASMRRAIEGFEALLEKSYHFDGFCEETPGYSTMHLNLMREIPELLFGYSDPEDYKGEPHLKDLNPFQHFDRYRLALESMVRQLDPNLQYPVIGDSRKGSTISPIYAEVLAAHYGNRYAGLLEKIQGTPLSEAGSEYALWHRDPNLMVEHIEELPHRTEWFPGWHVAVLRGGKHSRHTAFYLNGAAFGIHRHYDTLGILYIANGCELVPDRGYIWDDPRNAWTKSTLSHNLVTVDGQGQVGNKTPATLELFGTGPGIEIVQASANPYSQCDLYQRTCVLIQIPDGTYAVDLFRVRGGQQHRYGFHGSGHLTNLSGTALNPSAETIEWLNNIREATPQNPFTATYQDNDHHLDFTLLSPIDRLLVADAPGWRSDSGAELHAPPVQQIMAERTGKPFSHYAAIIAPYAGKRSPIQNMHLHHNPDTGAIGMVVERDGATDYIFSAPNGTHTIGDIALTGTFAFASFDTAKNLQRAYLLDGTTLKCGTQTLTLPQNRTTLRVASVTGRTFYLTENLTEGILPGTYLLAADTGYEIESITKNAITVRDYPAITCNTITLLHAAHWEKTP